MAVGILVFLAVMGTLVGFEVTVGGAGTFAQVITIMLVAIAVGRDTLPAPRGHPERVVLAVLAFATTLTLLNCLVVSSGEGAMTPLMSGLALGDAAALVWVFLSSLMRRGVLVAPSTGR